MSKAQLKALAIQDTCSQALNLKAIWRKDVAKIAKQNGVGFSHVMKIIEDK